MTGYVAANQQIRYPPSQTKGNQSHDYILGLLKLALEKTNDKYGLMDVVPSIRMQQARSVVELQRGTNVDIVSFGTSIERERQFLAIKIPMYRGLMGFRMAIIRKDFEQQFAQVKTFKDLSKYSACQGENWPDTKILEAAGLKVITNANYESIFRQVVAKRCDYFPRSVQEGPIEIALKAKIYPDLMLYRHLIIYYPYPAYFFVNKNNTDLHQRITKGLNLAIRDGSFQHYLNSHVSTKDLFPIEQWIKNPTIELANPLLSKDTDINDLLYWIRPQH